MSGPRILPTLGGGSGSYTLVGHQDLPSCELEGENLEWREREMVCAQVGRLLRRPAAVTGAGVNSTLPSSKRGLGGGAVGKQVLHCVQCAMIPAGCRSPHVSLMHAKLVKSCHIQDPINHSWQKHSIPGCLHSVMELAEACQQDLCEQSTISPTTILCFYNTHWPG